MGLCRQRRLAWADVHAPALVPRTIGAVRGIGQARGMDGDEITQRSLALSGQGLPGQVLVGEQRIATVWGISTAIRQVPAGGRAWNDQSACQFSANSGLCSSASRRIAAICWRPGIGAKNGSAGPAEREREALQIVVADRLVGKARTWCSSETARIAATASPVQRQ